MLRLAPTSTLFPYTTLFRSHRACRGEPHLDAALRHAARSHRRQLRAQREDADAPGTARLARSRVDAIEVVHEASAPADRHERRSEEHTSELQSRGHLVCRLL